RGEFNLVALKEQEQQEKLKRLNLDNAQTFSEYFEHFIRTITDSVKESTLQSYRYQFQRFLKPEFGGMPLSSIDRTAVETFLNKLKGEQYRRKHHKKKRKLAKDTLRLVI